MDVNKELDDAAAVSTVVKSAGRVFEVLELFRRVRRHMSAAEIGQALGYPKSSTNALLKSLVSLGYLVFDSAGLRYLPSLAITQLGDWIPAIVLPSGDAFQILNEVHEATRETVTLTVQTDLTCRFLRVIPGTFPISLSMSEGYVVPLLTTAVGVAIMAQLPELQVSSLCERHNAQLRKKAQWMQSAAILEQVREVRQRGYAVAYDAVLPDTGAIAVPFPSQIDGFPMAIGVGGLRDRMRRNEKSIVKAVGRILARHLGRSTRAGRERVGAKSA